MTPKSSTSDLLSHKYKLITALTVNFSNLLQYPLLHRKELPYHLIVKGDRFKNIVVRTFWRKLSRIRMCSEKTSPGHKSSCKRLRLKLMTRTRILEI